jgi:HAD superfamily hydrolase (TIGR01459 family)
MSIRSVPAVSGLEEIASRYDALMCDVWGVLHNGRESFRDASDALVAFRARGGVVILLTNAPRPNPPIRAQVLRLGVAAEAFDAVVTSGDVTLSLIAERIAEKVFHLGPQRDHALFDAAAKMAGAAPKLASLEEADYAVCTGLFDDTKETPADYESTLQEIRARKMPFICANPDLIVHCGDKVAFCAGALAKRLGEIGGDPIYCGKPHAPIYRVALRGAEFARGKPIAKRRVLAVGDSMRTDIAGAAAQGFDTLFVTAGIHVADVHGGGDETAALAALFRRENLRPSATVKTLRR